MDPSPDRENFFGFGEELPKRLSQVGSDGLWQTGVSRFDLGHEDSATKKLSGPRWVGIGCCENEEVASLRSSEHAGEGWIFSRNLAQDLAAFGHSDTTAVDRVGKPNGRLLIQTDAVWHATAEVGPLPPIRQSPVFGAIERNEITPERLSNDESRCVWSYHRAVRKRHVWVCNSGLTVWFHDDQFAGREISWRVTLEVESKVANVDSALAIDN